MDRHEDMPRSGFEFVVKEPEQLISFYRDVFGYDVLELQPETGQWYVHIRKPDLYGIMVDEARPIRKTSDADSPYLGNFYVDDIQAKLELVKAHGGRLFLEADETEPIKDVEWGRQVYCCDREQNMFGMVELINDHSS